MVYDIIVIGAGPAGLTAAIYAKRSSLKILIIEKSQVGGKLNKTSGIENYPGFVSIKGSILAKKIKQQVQHYKVDWSYEEVIKLEKKRKFLVSTSKKNIFASKAIIIASGAIENELKVKGESEFMNLGVSYCAICDVFAFQGKEVAVVGGGYSALEAALYMSNIASHVYLIHRRLNFRAEKEIVARVNDNLKITLLLNSILKEIRGKKVVEKIIISNTENNQSRELPISAVFPCIGLSPFSDLVHKLDVCDHHQYIIIKEDCSTVIPGLFAAGDVARASDKKIKQIVTAVAEGAIAAQSAIMYLEKSKTNKSKKVKI